MQPLRIETTVADVASELRRRGIAPEERVTLTIAAPEERAPGRPRAAVDVMALTDADVDRLIEHAWREIDQDVP